MRPIVGFWTVVLLSTALVAGPAPADAWTYAVVDRVGDDHAVLLVEDDGETEDRRVVQPAALHPDGRYEGAVHRVVDGEYVHDGAETERRRRATSRRFDGLSEEF